MVAMTHVHFDARKHQVRAAAQLPLCRVHEHRCCLKCHLSYSPAWSVHKREQMGTTDAACETDTTSQTHWMQHVREQWLDFAVVGFASVQDAAHVACRMATTPAQGAVVDSVILCAARASL